MFEPTTHWERRAALTEAMVMRLSGMVGAQDLLEQWAGHIDSLKARRVTEVLGLPPAGGVDAGALTQKLGELLIRKGLSLQNGDDVAVAAARTRIEQLPEIHEGFAADGRIASGLFKMGDQPGAEMLMVAFTDGDMQYIVAANGRYSVGQVALSSMPDEINLQTSPMAWRMLVFPYRVDLSAAGLETALAQLDAQYPDVAEEEDASLADSGAPEA